MINNLQLNAVLLNINKGYDLDTALLYVTDKSTIDDFTDEQWLVIEVMYNHLEKLGEKSEVKT